MNRAKLRKFKVKPNAKTLAARKLRTFLKSRLFVISFLILVQFLIMLLFTITLQSNMAYFFEVSAAVSAVFLLYLVNTPGKNEFKIAWILPVILAPFFGISLYFMYKFNQGGINLKKKLRKLRTDTKDYIPSKRDARAVAEYFPEVKDIAQYLYNFGDATGYLDSETQYFSCGEDFFADLIDELKKAERYIFIEFFIVEPCQILDKLLQILSKKAKEGVDVRILFDSIGSVALSSAMESDYFKSFGIQSKIWLKFIPVFNTGLNNRDHRKIISIDGKVSYTGGVNITDEYANIYSKRFAYWKDAGIKITGPASRTFTLMFLEMWNVQNKKNVPCENFENFIPKEAQLCLENHTGKGKAGLVIPYGDDAYNGADIGENVYRYILQNATKNVSIMTPYVIIDGSMMDTLIFAASRGVNVELIVPQYYDHFISFCVGRTYIKNLIENGVKVYAYQSGFIHSKVFIADNKMGTVGSINLDYRSFYHHFECGTFLYRTKSIKEAQKDFDKTKLECKEITVENYKKIPWYVRTTGWIFRIFGPLM